MVKGIKTKVFLIFSIILAIFHLYTSATGVLEPLIQRPFHLGIILSLAFITYAFTKNGKITVIDVLFSVASLVSVFYIILNYESIIMRSGTLTQLDIIFGVICIVLLFEATRRTNGLPLVILAGLFAIFMFYGPYMPNLIAHRGYDLSDFVYYMFLSTEGIFGTAVGVSATYIYLFILFGAVLQKSGLGALFNDISIALLGRYSGGPAKVAVVGSGFMGTINGSAIANVVTTGAFTIPLMKKLGYRSHFAGAVEAVSSVGGYLMPPIMASTAFIMAEMLNVPYTHIIVAALLPAILYYLTIIVMVHLRAGKQNIKGLPEDQIPNLKEVLRKRGFLLLPIILLVILLIFGFTPIFAAFYSIISAVIVSQFSKETKMGFADILDAFVIAAKNTIPVAIACAIVGIIMGVSTVTGLGLTASNVIIELGGGSLFLTLAFTMIACLVLGMGLPSIPTYILTATMAAPALIELGVPGMAAHLFVFYFGSMANLTPPVALAAFAAAGIAGSNPTKTGLSALKLAIAGFIVPYLFVYSPEMLLQSGEWWKAAKIFTSGLLGVLSLSVFIEGYGLRNVTTIERFTALIAAVLLITPQLITDVIGVLLFAILLIVQIRKVKKTDQAITNNPVL